MGRERAPSARVGGRRIAVLALGAALACTVVLLASDLRSRPPGPETADPAVPGAELEPCIRTGRLDSVAALNHFVTTVRGDGAFAGGDVGASVTLQDHRRIFVFGDTLRGADFKGQQFVRNSMLVLSPGCAQVLLPTDRGAVVPDRPDGVGYWPMSIARVERSGYDLVGVGLQRVRQTRGAGVFAFEILGPAVAQFRVPRGGVPELVAVRDVGPDHADTTRPMWGAAAFVEDGWVYLYGTSRRPGATASGFALRVARSRPESVADPSRWRYWDGVGWSEYSARAQILIAEEGGVSQTLSVFRQDSSWYAVSKRDEVLGTDLVVWKAPAPTGPFKALPPVANIPSEAGSGTLRYMPLAHQGLLPEPGTVVVSYSENNTDFDVVQDDPRRYRPRFVRVPLEGSR